MTSPKRVISLVRNDLRDLFFPPVCVGCGERLRPFDPERPIFCPVCRLSFESACRAHRDRSLVRLSPSSERLNFAYAHVSLADYRSGYTDGVPERLVYAVKHRDDRRMFEAVADRLAPLVLEACRMAQREQASEGHLSSLPVLFTYPPRRPSAIRRDGFDQAARLSCALAKVCQGQPVCLIDRVPRNNRAQKTMTAFEREKSASRVYRLNPKAASRVTGHLVVLTDDVVTTGSTLNACARLLTEAGAAAVICASVTAVSSGKYPETDRELSSVRR